MREIREKFPQYNDLSDQELALAVHKKFYSDMPYEEFASKVGVGVEEPSFGDKALSYGASALSGLTALPRGAFQLGANIGDALSDRMFEDQFGGRMELTPGAEQAAMDAGIPLPERYKNYGYGDAVNKTIQAQENVKRAMMEKAGREGFDWVELGGMMASPASFIKSGFAKATTMPQKMAEGAKVGAAYGAGMPVSGEDFARQKEEQVAAGAGIGMAMPPVVAALKAAGHYANEFRKPWTHKGVVKDVEKFVRENFDSGKEMVIQALRNAKKGETSGQAIARANRGQPESFGSQIVRTEAELAKKTHGGDILKSVYEKQRTGRERIIDRIAKTDADLKAAEGARKSAAGTSYEKAFETTAKANQELLGIIQNPYIKKAMGTADDLAKAKGVNTKDNLIEYLHFVKIGIDKQLGKTGDDALSNAERGAAQEAKKKLVKWMGEKAPDYEKARIQFAEKSVPINRMQTGQELKKALVQSTEAAEKPSTFLTATKEAPRTLKRSTGFGRYDELGDVLTPGQVSGVRKVADQLVNEAKRTKMASQGESMLPQLSGEIKFELPHILSRPIVVANHILVKMGQNKTPEYREVLAKIMKDPKELERILSGKESNAKKIAEDILNNLTKAPTLGVTSEAGK